MPNGELGSRTGRVIDSGFAIFHHPNGPFSEIARIDELQGLGYGHYPVCIAKTQYSFSTDPNARGAPSGHIVTIREVRLAAGAEFVVVICGDVMTMPGLPKVPSAEKIDIGADGVDDPGHI